MKNRKWFYHNVEFEVPANGTAVIEIRFKNKWPVKKDFFIDNITLNAVADDGTTVLPIDGSAETPVTSGPTRPTEQKVVRVSIPEGMNVITAVSNSPNTVIITVPAGIKIITE